MINQEISYSKQDDVSRMLYLHGIGWKGIETELNEIMNVKIVFNFDSQEEARVIAESLHPEIENKIPKTDVKIFVDKKICSLFIESKDVSSLRAACNPSKI